MKIELSNRLLIIIAFLSVCAGVFFMWGISIKLDKEEKSNLMVQADIVAKLLNIERLKKLRGNQSDLKSSDYSRIKQQLYDVRTSNEACQFLYILGYDQEKDNVFFFVDSQIIGSEDYAPPGLIYEEVTDEFKNAVKLGKATFVGPVTDRWGTIVTALIPLKSPETGEIIAVLGMDVKADAWFSHLIQRSMLPIGLIFLTMVLIVLALIMKMKTNELRQTVRLDSLTNLLSRKTILEQAKIELSRSRYSGNPFSIIVLDIDNFKNINDLYGHQAGDDVLQRISACLKQSIRKTDMAGRIGGEEFIILLPDTNEDNAVTIAEKVRNSIERLNFDSDIKPELEMVSASFGVSTAVDKSKNFKDLYAQADKALYKSKRDGKNKVSCYKENL